MWEQLYHSGGPLRNGPAVLLPLRSMYDVIVIGLGGMGAATVCHLANRGLRLLGIDQFDVPHTLGSSHGLSRIIRLAYFESPAYVPLLIRAYELWADLEQRTGSKLLLTTGSIDAGPEDSLTIRGSLHACREFGLQHEILDAATLARRFPGYRLPRAMAGVLQPQGGFLIPESCVTAHLEVARASGAEIHVREKVLGWDADGHSIVVRTDATTYKTARLVIAAGPWSRNLLPAIAEYAIPERQVVMWTEPLRPEHFQLDTFPVFNLQASADATERYYGGPMHDGAGFKIGRYHHRFEQVQPDSMDRTIHDADEAVLRAGIKRFFPDANGRMLDAITCIFTNSPDEHFILDTIPGAPDVAIAAGFSGHGFKFCSVVGEIMADLVTTGETRHNIALFRMDRFGFRR
jgi:sarcosine oxidase